MVLFFNELTNGQAYWSLVDAHMSAVT